MPQRKGQHAVDHALLRPVAARPDGTPIMPTERIAEALRLGSSDRTAAARAGVSVAALQTWLRSGNRHSASLLAGTRTERELSPIERAELALARAVATAVAEHELNLLALLEQASRGAEARTTTVQLAADGTELARTERTQRDAPDAASLRWRLERRHPEQWAPRQRVEHTGADGGAIQVDVAQRAAELADALRAQANGRAAVAPSNGSGGNGH